MSLFAASTVVKRLSFADLAGATRSTAPLNVRNKPTYYGIVRIRKNIMDRIKVVKAIRSDNDVIEKI